MSLLNFTAPPTAPILIGGVGQGGPVDAFVARFGTSWKRTPVKGVWFIGAPGVQFTLRGEEVAYYDYATVEEFKDAFKNRPSEVAGNAEYFNIPPTMKYSGLAVMAYIADRSL